MRIAVIGLGFMGATHARAWRRVPGVTLAAVVSSDPLKLSGDFSGVGGNLENASGNLDFSSVRKFSEVDAAILDRELDAIDICLPSDQHFGTAQKALRAGKHVIVEKPLALAGDEADLLLEEARKTGRILMAGQVLRFIPEYRQLVEILRADRLGPVKASFFRRRCGAPGWSRWQKELSRSGGAVMDLLIHDIDFCLHLYGKPTYVSALGFVDLSRGIDWVEARLTFENTGPVIVTGGWHHPKTYPFQMEFTVISAGGTLEFRSGTGPMMLFDASGSSEPLETVQEDPFVEELKYFAECAADGRRPTLCPPEESAMAVKVANLIMDSRARQGETIACRF